MSAWTLRIPSELASELQADLGQLKHLTNAECLLRATLGSYANARRIDHGAHVWIVAPLCFQLWHDIGERLHRNPAEAAPVTGGERKLYARLTAAYAPADGFC